MQTVLLAQSDEKFADHVATELRSAGFHVVICPGPLPPRLRCIRCDKGYCPLSEGADLMIYDPALSVMTETGRTVNLAVESAHAHPDVPMLLAWPPGRAPEFARLRALKAEAPNMHAAASDPRALVLEIRKLLAANSSHPRSD